MPIYMPRVDIQEFKQGKDEHSRPGTQTTLATAATAASQAAIGVAGPRCQTAWYVAKIKQGYWMHTAMHAYIQVPEGMMRFSAKRAVVVVLDQR